MVKKYHSSELFQRDALSCLRIAKQGQGSKENSQQVVKSDSCFFMTDTVR